jgi:multidrug efflux pump subunit AcrA (membrane-fusion protein)
MSALFVRQDRHLVAAGGALALLLLFAGCNSRKNAVSGTIEVDEAHVGPRMAGRVEKIFAQEGDQLKEGQVIAQLEASELRARRDLAAAQIDTAIRDADAAGAQLEFLRADSKRQKDLLARKVVSPNDAERADSAAKTQEKNVEAAQNEDHSGACTVGRHRITAEGDASSCAGEVSTRSIDRESR